MKMSNGKIFIMFGIICFVLSFSIVIQVKTIKSANSPVSKNIVDNQLRDEVLKKKEEYEKTIKELEKAEKKLNNFRNKAAENDSEAVKLHEEIKNNNDVLGLTDVTGPGVVITINSGKIDNKLKEDLDSIINELKNAGAEAIAINGERLVFSSVISCQENFIKLNEVTIETPFVIEAIGDSKLIYNELLRPGGYIELINERVNKIEVIKASKINIKKFSGKINIQYMKTVT